MERQKIAAIYADSKAFDGQSITVCGWVRTVRDMKNFGFIELNDGSTKDITYYKADQNFFTVVYENGTKAASTNKLYVNIMLDDLKKLSEGI